MAFHFVYDRAYDHRPWPNLTPVEPVKDGSFRRLGDSWPRIAPCRLLMYCEDHAYPYTVSYVTDTIPAGAWYPIGLAWFDHDLDYFALIPENTLDLVRNRQLTVLFYYHEGDNPVREKQRLDALCRAHGLDSQCYRFVSGNTAAAALEGFVWFCEHELFYWHADQSALQDLGPLAHDRVRPYTFTLLSRVHKWWRATVVAHLRDLGLLDRAQWSYGVESCGDLAENNPIETVQLPGLDLSQFVAGAPYRCDTLTAEQHNDHRHQVDSLYTDSYLSVVLETLYDAEQSGGAFITEKTFKAVRNGHPFVLFGCVSSLAAVQSLGYRTFSSEIDETYDTVQHNSQRFATTVRALLQVLAQGNLHQWYQRLGPVIQYNQRLFAASKYSRLETLEQQLQNP